MPATARAAIERAVLDLDAALADSLPLLFDFLGVADPERPAAAMDPEARQRQLFGALNRLRRARSDRARLRHGGGGPALARSGERGVPGERRQRRPRHPLCSCVTTFRPEYRAPWAHRSHYGQLPLSPLGGRRQRRAGRTICSAPTRRSTGWPNWCGSACGGNPFFIQEVVQSLVEDGSLVGGRGAYELVRTIGELSIPATVQAVLAARIDRLPERDKTLLQTASVIGRQFSGPLAGRVAGLAEVTSSRRPLRSLVEGEFVYETATYPEEEYAFKHALTEEVAYRSQLAKHRARTHAAVAGALAELDADKLDERASLIAHHYELGGELLEAARWNARAAAWAGISHPVEAARRWRRVRALTDRLDAVAGDRGAGHQRPSGSCSAATCGSAPPARRAGISYEDEAAQMFAEADAFAEAADRRTQGARPHGLRRGSDLSEAVEEGYERTWRPPASPTRPATPPSGPSARVALDWGLFVLGRVREAAEVTRRDGGHHR